MAKVVSHTVVFSSGVIKEVLSDTYNIPGIDLNNLPGANLDLLYHMWILFTLNGEVTGRIRLGAIDGIIPHFED